MIFEDYKSQADLNPKYKSIFDTDKVKNISNFSIERAQKKNNSKGAQNRPKNRKYLSEMNINSINRSVSKDHLKAENHADDTLPGYDVNLKTHQLNTEGSAATFNKPKSQKGTLHVPELNASHVSSYSAFPEDPHYANKSNPSSDLYIKPLIDQINFSSQKVLAKSSYLLKNEDKISKHLFTIAFEAKDRFNSLMKDTRKIVNKSKFMSFSSWIPKLIDNIYDNLEEHTERLQSDKKFSQKLTQIFNTLEMGIPPKNTSISSKLDSVLQEILEIKANSVIAKKNYQMKLDSICNNDDVKQEQENNEKIKKEFTALKSTVESKNSALFSQIANMENLIARIDHERRAYRDRNEFLEEENASLNEELTKFKKISIELDKSLEKSDRLKNKYYNISMMQMAECESLRLRNSNKHLKYSKLRQEHDDLKHELTLLFKEKQIINAANKEESFKKEDMLLAQVRKLIPGKANKTFDTVTMVYRDKVNGLTKESNASMFSKNVRVMKPSFFHLISEK